MTKIADVGSVSEEKVTAIFNYNITFVIIMIINFYSNQFLATGKMSLYKLFELH